MQDPSQLHLVTTIFNPRKFKRRYELYHEFAKMIERAGVTLHTVELALGNRPFEVTNSSNPNHLQFRSDDEWWAKENLLNLGFRSVPEDVKYIAWADADISFADPNWASNTVDSLQHHPVVQMFSQASNLNPNMEPFQIWDGFGATFESGEGYAPIGAPAKKHWHPGFCWAYRREAYEAFGGFLDRIVLGSADSHMAASLVNKAKVTVHGRTTDAFKKYVYDWEANAQRYLNFKGQTIGFTPGLILHYWHGPMRSRQYRERWDILVDHQYDPYQDLYPDMKGLLHFTDRVPGLRADCRKYFAMRNEDSVDYDGSEKTIKFTWEITDNNSTLGLAQYGDKILSKPVQPQPPLKDSGVHVDVQNGNGNPPFVEPSYIHPLTADWHPGEYPSDDHHGYHEDNEPAPFYYDPYDPYYLGGYRERKLGAVSRQSYVQQGTNGDGTGYHILTDNIPSKWQTVQAILAMTGGWNPVITERYLSADYNLTTNYAPIYGTSSIDLEVFLSTGGTYLISANLSIMAGSSNADEDMRAKLYNSTTSSDISASERGNGALPLSALGQILLTEVVTVTAPTTIQVWAVNNTGAHGTVLGGKSRISFMPLNSTSTSSQST